MNWSFTKPGLATSMHFTTKRKRKSKLLIFNSSNDYVKTITAMILIKQPWNICGGNKLWKREKCATRNRNILCVCLCPCLCTQQHYHRNWCGEESPAWQPHRTSPAPANTRKQFRLQEKYTRSKYMRGLMCFFFLFLNHTLGVSQPQKYVIMHTQHTLHLSDSCLNAESCWDGTIL